MDGWPRHLQSCIERASKETETVSRPTSNAHPRHLCTLWPPNHDEFTIIVLILLKFVLLRESSLYRSRLLTSNLWSSPVVVVWSCIHIYTSTINLLRVRNKASLLGKSKVVTHIFFKFCNNGRSVNGLWRVEWISVARQETTSITTQCHHVYSHPFPCKHYQKESVTINIRAKLWEKMCYDKILRKHC